MGWGARSSLQRGFRERDRTVMANEEPIEAAQCSVLSALLTQHLMANSPSSFSCRGVVQPIFRLHCGELENWKQELEESNLK